MRLILWGAAALALVSTAAVAADDPMANLYGNTVVVVDGKGLESHTNYNADHTFSGVAPAYSYHYKGTWEMTADGKLCRTFDPPVPGITNPDCAAATSHAVGDKWSGPDGSSGTLVQGMAPETAMPAAPATPATPATPAAPSTTP
ncbi:MAG TPA: hypothetical protein VNU97_00170 [Rhizomicrobium sp.]|jgi:hypothetical protein|nr:hypothetical protein [Rhizomicrobium sp.]